MPAALLLVVVAAALLPLGAGVVTTTVSNVLPRRSASGEVMDAHDSKMLFINGTFYWFAGSYGDCIESPGPSGCANLTTGACGFQTNHNVSLFVSTDLVHWSDPVVVFTATDIGVPGAIMAAPKVIFNPRTAEFVLWANWFLLPGSPAWSQSYYTVAASATPTGPFALKTQMVHTLAFQDVGDINLLVDDDGEAYVIYTAHISMAAFQPSHVMSIERLAPDYYTSLGPNASSGIIGSSFVEAPMIFKRSGVYHAVFGQCCCNDASGTAALTDYTADSPLGPWVSAGVVGTQASLPAQSTDIVQYVGGDGQPAYLYIGDRWQSSYDRVKAHDFTLFAPLSFSSTSSGSNSGALQPIENLPNFTITIGE
jgi:hypothetical protein